MPSHDSYAPCLPQSSCPSADFFVTCCDLWLVTMCVMWLCDCHMIFPTLHLSNNLKEKKRNINIDLAILPSHDMFFTQQTSCLPHVFLITTSWYIGIYSPIFLMLYQLYHSLPQLLYHPQVFAWVLQSELLLKVITRRFPKIQPDHCIGLISQHSLPNICSLSADP